jgi:hypothetical protein
LFENPNPAGFNKIGYQTSPWFVQSGLPNYFAGLAKRIGGSPGAPREKAQARRAASSGIEAKAQ